MAVMIVDRETRREFIRQRRRLGHDMFDEVWNGVYVMSPIADFFHQVLSLDLGHIFKLALGGIPGVIVCPPINLTDRADDWRKNYRCPDASVILPGNAAEIRGSHLYGGPDFVVEIISPGDRSRKKLDFYAKVGTREVLIVDRKPWSLELYRSVDGIMKLTGKVDVGMSDRLASEVLPLTFSLIPGEARPEIEVIHTQDARRWLA